MGPRWNRKLIQKFHESGRDDAPKVHFQCNNEGSWNLWINLLTCLSGVGNMAKKVTGMIKLQIPAGKANPAPPVGPALGQHGVNIMEFCKQFNAKTQGKGDTIIPVIITVYQDRS